MNNSSAKEPRKAHFIGVSGMGMSAVAVLLKEDGWIISGSDAGSYEPAAGYLLSQEITFSPEYKPQNIPDDADLIVIGRHAKLVPEENAEVQAAFASGILIRSFAEVLGELSEKSQNTVIAGSYGKSTCSALLTWCLIEGGLDPSYFIGAVPLDMTQTSHLGKTRQEGGQFILEGDEYQSSNWDHSSKFLHYHAQNIILTSGEHDHINVFPQLADYLAPYQELLNSLPQNGLVMAAIEHPNVESLIKETKAQVVTYGLRQGTWQAVNIKYGQTSTFNLTKNDQAIGEFATVMLGAHNIENIVGVAAFILEKELLPVQTLIEAIAKFKGLKRRLDSKTEKSSVPVYEGFGSSYTKAKTVFNALRLHFPERNIVAIFEPHTFSWRNRGALEWYRDVFNDVRDIIIYEPPTHGASTHDQLSLSEIVQAVKESKESKMKESKVTEHVIGVRSADEAMIELEKLVGPNDLIAIVSSGEMGGLIKIIPDWTEQKFPKLK